MISVRTDIDGISPLFRLILNFLFKPRGRNISPSSLFDKIIKNEVFKQQKIFLTLNSKFECDC